MWSAPVLAVSTVAVAAVASPAPRIGASDTGLMVSAMVCVAESAVAAVLSLACAVTDRVTSAAAHTPERQSLAYLVPRLLLQKTTTLETTPNSRAAPSTPQ